MKSPMRASAIAVLLAPALLAPARAHAQPFWAYHAPPHSYWPPWPGYGYPPPYYGRPVSAAPHYAPRVPPGYDPERPARSGWRRGQFLPPDFRGVVVEDYARFHLRRPPRGYFWYRDADDYVLASASTGLIFEVIPGA
jgi:Nickel/cobalt transporter regulator